MTCWTRSSRATSSRVSSPTELVRRGYPEDVVADVVRMVDRAEYKRRQGPGGHQDHAARLRPRPAHADNDPACLASALAVLAALALVAAVARGPRRRRRARSKADDPEPLGATGRRRSRRPATFARTLPGAQTPAGHLRRHAPAAPRRGRAWPGSAPSRPVAARGRRLEPDARRPGERPRARARAARRERRRVVARPRHRRAPAAPAAGPAGPAAGVHRPPLHPGAPVEPARRPARPGARDLTARRPARASPSSTAASTPPTRSGAARHARSSPRAAPWSGDNDASDRGLTGHGTHVAGIAAAPANGVGVVGVAPAGGSAAQVIPVQIADREGAAATTP